MFSELDAYRSAHGDLGAQHVECGVDAVVLQVDGGIKIVDGDFGRLVLGACAGDVGAHGGKAGARYSVALRRDGEGGIASHDAHVGAGYLHIGIPADGEGGCHLRRVDGKRRHGQLMCGSGIAPHACGHCTGRRGDGGQGRYYLVDNFLRACGGVTPVDVLVDEVDLACEIGETAHRGIGGKCVDVGFLLAVACIHSCPRELLWDTTQCGLDGGVERELRHVGR